MNYYTAYICLNGHVSSSYADGSDEKYCKHCGETIINSCPHCNSKIRGSENVEGVVGFFHYSPPAYCYNCGKAFPWTERKLEALQELVEFDENMQQEQKEYIIKNSPSIVVDTPKSKVVATKLKAFLSKASSATASAVRDIIVDVASEAVKKTIYPD